MAATEVAIANMALLRMRHSQTFSGTTVAGLSGTTLAEQVLKVWYAPTRQNVIRDHPWQFALRLDILTLVETFEDGDPEYGRWLYSYRMPTGALLVRAIRSPQEGRKTTPPNEWEISADATGQLIFTDVEDAICEYMKDETVTTNYDAKFESAFVWRLAAELANALPADDKIRAACWQGYLYELAGAEAANANEQEQGKDPDGEFVRSRSGA